jgi:hypothetical protein
MALCTSCGNQVEDSASFCTSCGKAMPAAVQPSASVTVTRPLCPSCGAQGDPDSVFCTECGKRLETQPAPIDETASPATATRSARLDVETGAATPSPVPFCTSCGTRLEPGNGFCTKCGEPVAASGLPVASATPITTPSNSNATAGVSPDIAQPPIAPIAAESTVVLSAPKAVEATTVEPARAAVAAAVPTESPAEPAPQIATPLYAATSNYEPAQPGGGAFRAIVLILVLLIVVGGFGGWYFMGVETVIVSSPPDVTVFLDGKELPPTSYGRYVIPHLSRQPHLLRVQRAGFAETIQRLDFPLTSLHEWVNMKLVPRRPSR